MIKAYQQAWTISTLRHLGARGIACGAECPVIMLYSLISKSKPRLVLRNSDDFFPQIDSSHAWHLFCNAHNSLMTQHLHIIPDWDMFQTNHPWAYYHGAARCISGGPVYITDYPGQHDINLIKQMTALTPRGETVVIRPQRVAKSSNAYTSYDEPRLLKIDTYNGAAKTGISIVGVFNTWTDPLSELIKLSQFPGTEEGEYIIRSYVTGETTSPAKRGSDSAVVHLELGQRGYDILSAHPVRRFETKDRHIEIANLGLVDKMSGSAAIVSQQVKLEDTGRLRVWTSLKALGVYGLYIDSLPEKNLKKDFLGTLFGQPLTLDYVAVSDKNDKVLTIDLEKAWKDGNYKQTWSNEVAVEIFVF
jgi:hypothetical protein